MNFYHISLLLLVVLSAYSGSPQHAKPPDSPNPIRVTNNSSAQLGILAPGLPQNEVYRSTLPQNEVFRIVLPQNGVFILPQNEALKSVTANCQLFCNLKIIMDFILDIHVKSFRSWTWILHGAEKLGFTIRIVMESFQHVLKMYTWSLSENEASVKFKCRLIQLFLKQSLFRKHDFAVYVYKLYLGYQKPSSWHFRLFSDKQTNFDPQIRENCSNNLNDFDFYGGGQALIFSTDELLPYASTDLSELQYKFLRCVKIDNKESPVLANDEILCKIPLDVLAPKVTIKCAKEISMLHDMFMPSKIQLKNAQILLKEHKCQCGNFMSVFKPHKMSSNAEYQRKWYQNHKEKRAEYNMQPEYQTSNRKSAHKYYWSKKDVKFPPDPPSTDLCQKIVSEFSADTAPEVFEEAGCAVCGKLTPICEMEELSEVENVGLLKVDGVTRKTRSKSSDPVKELRGPILAPGCSRVCPICVESLEKKKVPTLALANGLWIGKIPDELKDLTYAEQLLIARVRHNRCIVKVSSGMSKMRANAISFSNPMPKIYNVLPPPIEELDEVLAFIYTKAEHESG